MKVSTTKPTEAARKSHQLGRRIKTGRSRPRSKKAASPSLGLLRIIQGVAGYLYEGVSIQRRTRTLLPFFTIAPRARIVRSVQCIENYFIAACKLSSTCTSSLIKAVVIPDIYLLQARFWPQRYPVRFRLRLRSLKPR